MMGGLSKSIFKHNGQRQRLKGVTGKAIVHARRAIIVVFAPTSGGGGVMENKWGIFSHKSILSILNSC